MAKRIIGIILVIAALGTVLLGIKAGGAAPENKKIVESAAVVSDGKVLSENEGKVVIVTGTLEAPLPFVDEETGVSLNSVVAYRHVEKLVIEKDEDGHPDTWSWNAGLEKDYGGSKKLIAPNLRFGEFKVSDALMISVNAHDLLNDYSDAELSALGLEDFKEEGVVYLYAGEIMPHQGDKIRTTDIFGKVDFDYKDLVDTLRVHYSVLASGSLDYTIIGLQRNGTLEDVEALKMTDVISGHLTANELLEYADSSASTSKTTAFIIAAVLAGIGALLIIKGGKTAEAGAKGKKRA